MTTVTAADDGKRTGDGHGLVCWACRSVVQKTLPDVGRNSGLGIFLTRPIRNTYSGPKICSVARQGAHGGSSASPAGTGSGLLFCTFRFVLYGGFNFRRWGPATGDESIQSEPRHARPSGYMPGPEGAPQYGQGLGWWCGRMEWSGAGVGLGKSLWGGGVVVV